MANERLRSALLRSGVAPAQLAVDVGVNPKTVERWILYGREPYRRHRQNVAVRLGMAESYLWPDALTSDEVAEASASEIVHVYPHRWAVPRDVWGRLFDPAEREIGMLVHRGEFAADDLGVRTLFRAKAERGVRIRILLSDPDVVRFRSLLDAGRVEIRQHSTVPYHSIYRADSELLVNCRVYGYPAAQGPVLHLRQIAGGSLVSTYLDSFERVWSAAGAPDGSRDTG